MSAALAKIQAATASGPLASSTPAPTTTRFPRNFRSSALITFGMAWGINNGVLDSKVYTPVVTRAWAGMLHHIYEDGRPATSSKTGAAPSTF